MANITHISKETLIKAPAKVVKVFLCASKISNDLNIATKHMWFARNTYFGDCKTASPIDASASRSVFLHRMIMLAGHAQECFNFLESSPVRFITKSDAMKKFEKFDPMASSLRKYFKGENLISTLRNKLSFHTDASYLYQTLLGTPAGFKFDILSGDFLGHLVFCGADELIEKCVYSRAPSPDLPKRSHFALASDQIFQVTDMMGVLMQILIAYVAIEHFMIDVNLGNYDVELPSGPPIDEVTLPFFCAPPADDQLRNQVLRMQEDGRS